MILMVYILTLIGTIALIFFSVDWTIELYKWQSRIHIGRWTDRKAWQQAVEKGTPMAIQKPYRTDYGSRSVSPLGYAKRELSFHHHTKLAGCRTPLSLPEQDAQEYVKRHPSLFIKENWQIDQSLLAYVLKKKDALYMETEKEIKEHFISYQQTEQTIPYRKTLPHIRFVDTIGLVCPFTPMRFQ